MRLRSASKHSQIRLDDDDSSYYDGPNQDKSVGNAEMISIFEPFV